MSQDSVSSYWQLTHASSELSGIKMSQKGKLLSVIGDEDTCVGFLLGGIGEINKSRQTNFMVVEKTTTVGEIEKCFSEFTKREEIAIILITQIVADTIRAKLEAHTSTSMKPVVIEIPSKDHPYDENKDAIMRRAKVNPFFRLSEENAEPNLLKFGDS